MCFHNEQLSAAGHLGPILSHVADYVKTRVQRGDEETVLNSLALFSRVGARGEFSPQLQSLCAIVGIAPERALHVADHLKDSPGFINVAGRYLYVTPEDSCSNRV